MTTNGACVAQLPTWTVPSRRLVRGDRRHGSLTDLHIVCRCGGFDVTLLARKDERTRNLAIFGQVTSAIDRHVPCANVAVALVSPDLLAPLATCRTNAFGEFKVERISPVTLGILVGDEVAVPCVLVWEPSL